MPELAPSEVAARVAGIIRDHPANWDQGTWARITSDATTGAALAALEDGQCETAACVAGWAAILTVPAATEWSGTHAVLGHVDSVIIDGTPAQIQVIAMRALGLQPFEAMWLFDGYRGKDEVLAALGEIEAGQRITIPDEEYDPEDMPF